MMLSVSGFPFCSFGRVTDKLSLLDCKVMASILCHNCTPHIIAPMNKLALYVYHVPSFNVTPVLFLIL